MINRLPALTKYLKGHTQTCRTHIYSRDNHECTCGYDAALIELAVINTLLSDLETMRQAQKDYFATRLAQPLKDAKYWERKIDQTLQILTKSQKVVKEVQQEKLLS